MHVMCYYHSWEFVLRANLLHSCSCSYNNKCSLLYNRKKTSQRFWKTNNSIIEEIEIHFRPFSVTFCSPPSGNGHNTCVAFCVLMYIPINMHDIIVGLFGRLPWLDRYSVLETSACLCVNNPSTSRLNCFCSFWFRSEISQPQVEISSKVTKYSGFCFPVSFLILQ